MDISFSPSVLLKLINSIYHQSQLIEKQEDLFQTSFWEACDFFQRHGPWKEQLILNLKRVLFQNHHGSRNVTLKIFRTLCFLSRVPSLCEYSKSFFSLYQDRLTTEERQQLSTDLISFSLSPGGEKDIVLESHFNLSLYSSLPSCTSVGHSVPSGSLIVSLVNHHFISDAPGRYGVALQCPSVWSETSQSHISLRAKIRLRLMALTSSRESIFSHHGMLLERHFKKFSTPPNRSCFHSPGSPISPCSEWESQDIHHFQLPFPPDMCVLLVIPSQWIGTFFDPQHLDLRYQFRIQLEEE